VIWQKVVQVIRDPALYLDELRRQVRERKGLAVDVEERRRLLAAAVVENEQARQRVLELNRRGLSAWTKQTRSWRSWAQRVLSCGGKLSSWITRSPSPTASSAR
jgi:hypothetical protein